MLLLYNLFDKNATEPKPLFTQANKVPDQSKKSNTVSYKKKK